MKIYVIAGLHGDEPFGLNIIGKLQQRQSPDIRTRVGHPEAIAKHVRFLESDLNRSFTAECDTIESELAVSIRADIDSFRPDCIIDIHTSVSNVKNVAIVARRTSITEKVAQTLNMTAIVEMPPHLAETSLIGCYEDIAVSIEYGKNQQSDKLAEYIAMSIKNLNNPLPNQIHHTPAFRVISTVPKKYHGLKDIVNLTYASDLDGYPFLAGENTYPDIGGFLAEKIR